MDKSLDDIIKSRPRGRRSGGRAARAQIIGNRGAISPVARQRIKATKTTSVQQPAAPAQQPSDKIIVSNLPPDVNEQQVKELFHTTVGPLREVKLHYDSNGRSTGVASVHFQRKGDGSKAYTQYNSRLIDGRKPMKIEIVVDPTRLPGPTLASRVAPAGAGAAAAAPAQTATAARGGPRRGRGRGRGGKSKNDRPAKSAADLDAEMEDYTSSTAPAAAT